MEEDQEKQVKKFSFVEILFITPIVLFVDFLTFLANITLGIPVIGGLTEIAGSFIGGGTTIALQFYLSMKGVKNLWFLVGGILDTIPLLNTFPTQTIGWIMVVLMENNPKLKKLAGKIDKTGVGKIAEKI